VLGLHELGVPSITLANRSRSRARQLAADLQSVPIEIVDLDGLSLVDALRRASILVNATALGWKAGEAPLDLGLLDAMPDDALVVDLTYRETDLLVSARVRGLRTLDGLAMLVHQGAKALELWTNQPAPLTIMREAALRARAERIDGG
jgi:shikimate dehydrogenase